MSVHARGLEQAGIAALVLALIAVPTVVHGWPVTLAGNLFTGYLLAGGLTTVWWRTRPRLTALLGGGLWVVPAVLSADGWMPGSALVVMVLMTTAAALGWTDRAAWLAGAGVALYLGTLWLILPGTNAIGLAMFSVPGFVAGTVYRLHRETADQLARRGQELEDERELFAELAMGHERARIAAELHDIVGHAISVMVIQAAAGQRLVDRDPDRAGQTFAAIAESARQGKDDLQRLIELLGGGAVTEPDLSLIEDVVTRAGRSGLQVSCEFAGDRDGVPAPAAHVAFRVVQESLTNALRHAPGAAVRVLVDGSGTALTISVENDRPMQARPALTGTGRGLTGLRERVQEQGGNLNAGPTAHGGWLVQATLPT